MLLDSHCIVLGLRRVRTDPSCIMCTFYKEDDRKNITRHGPFRILLVAYNGIS